MGRRALLVASCIFLLVGCGGDEQDTDVADGTSARPATATTAASITSLPSVTEPPPTRKELIGTWSRIGTAGIVRFDANGEFRMARNTVDLDKSPYALGTYRLTGSKIELAGGCTSAWNIGLIDHDTLHGVVAEGGCALERGAVMELARISLP